MPERDGYLPGVPCWVDTSQPDPKAAVDFYRGLFGWDVEDMMLRHAGVLLHGPASTAAMWAAIGSIPDGAPPMATWNTYIAVADADATAAKVPRRRRPRGDRSLRRDGAGRMAMFADPEGRRVQCLAGGAAQRGAASSTRRAR
jgi:predicted enzyme related to lactoylglutathione lyase